MKDMNVLLNGLKFFGIKNSLDHRLQECAQGNFSFKDFLLLLLDDESLYRRNRKAETLRKRAKFKDKAYLEEFYDGPKRGISKSMLQQLATLYFIEQKENVLFIGGTGAGKSYLAQALGNLACMQGTETYFTAVNRLFKEIEIQQAQGSYLTFINRLARFKLLILDDLGLRNYTHEEANILYEILEDRYQKGSTIITSQVRPQGWKCLFGDAVIAEAILDRITSCAHIIEVKGESFRPNHKPKKKLEREENEVKENV